MDQGQRPKGPLGTGFAVIGDNITYNPVFKDPALASETELLRLALLAYDAAVEPAFWPRFLELYNDAASSESTVLQTHDLSQNRSSILSGFGISSPLQQSYNEHYSKLNVWRIGGRSLYVPGAVNLDQEQCPRHVLERSEFYNDFLKRIRTDHSMGAVITRGRNQAPTLTALRGKNKGEYSEAERKIARFLLPHLASAWVVYERLELLAAGESVLNRLVTGIAFLCTGGAVVYCNRAAEEIFRANDGLSLEADTPHAAEPRANDQLRSALHVALSPGPLVDRAAVGVPRPSGRRAYQIVTAPLRSRFRQFVGMVAPRAVLLITDPERPEPAQRDLLIQLYGLTPKEAEMAARLFEGKSLELVADQMHITYQTARTHLRRIFGKTGTSRQTELLLLLAQLPGAQAT
jgi:DNA-binding CsgD family transcriptional regulator